jgi:hypothetical protein
VFYVMLNYSWSSSIDTTLCLAAMCQPAPLAAVTTDDLYNPSQHCVISLHRLFLKE